MFTISRSTILYHLLFFAFCSIAWTSSRWKINLLNIPPELPAQTCQDALENGIEYTEATPLPEPFGGYIPFPEPKEILAPNNLPKIYSATKERMHPSTIPPTELPLQALEGYPEDIAKVGQAIRDAENGERIRFTFFGASHTGGDFWTGHIRRVLQARYGDIGHGFVMPVALYSGHRASDLNLCGTDSWIKDYVGRTDGHNDSLLGLGMSVSSDSPTDFTWMETTHTNPIGRQFSTAHIFALGQFGGGSLLAQIDRQAPILLPTHTDTNRFLQLTVHVPNTGHRLTISPAGDGEIRLFGVSLESEGSGVLVDSIGIRGREAKTWLGWDQELFQDGIHALQPDVIVLAYGTNEANNIDYPLDMHRSDLEQVLSKMRSVAPDAACILVGPTDRAKELPKGALEVWEKTEYIAQIQREVAPNFGCVFWDWQQAMGGKGSMAVWRHTEPPLASADVIHLSIDGYSVSAESFIQALDHAASQYILPSKKPFFKRR